jgi:hypothetical protein
MQSTTLIASLRRTLTSGSAFLLLAAPSVAHAVSTGLTETANESGIATESIDSRIGTIISAALGLVGVIFLVLMIYGGFLWMTAGGESDRVDDAKKIVRNAVIGLILIFSAYAITELAFQAVGVGGESAQEQCAANGGTWIEDSRGGSCL